MRSPFRKPPASAAPKPGRLACMTIGLHMAAACAGGAGEAATDTAPTRFVLHFSDCQAGAASDCKPGDNGQPGTEAAPKRDLAGIDLNLLPAGTALLFKRGGAWAGFNVFLVNRNATEAAPLVFGDWGTGMLPLLTTTAHNAVSFGRFGDTLIDGGYVFRNLRFDGRGSAQWGFFVQGATRNVMFDGVEITGFGIGIHAQQSTAARNTKLVVRNSLIHRNRQHGMLGDAMGLVIEGSTFEANNASGSPMHHGIYLGGKGSDLVMRGNRFIRNSVVGGQCTGGNVTIHGQWSNALIENNLIEQDAATGGCYGFSITPGYTTAEGFLNFTVRGNTVVNVGACAVCAGAAPGIVVEGNRLINRRPSFQVGVLIPTGVGGNLSEGDEVDRDAVVRDNTICFPDPHPQSTGTRVSGPGAVVTNNKVLTGKAATAGACAP